MSRPTDNVYIARSGNTVERSWNDLFAIPALGAVLKSQAFLWALRFVVLVLFILAVAYGFIYPSAKENSVTTGFFWGMLWPFFMLFSLATLGPIICSFCPHGFIGTYLSKLGLQRPVPKALRNPFIGLSIILVAYWGVYYFFTPFRSPLVTAVFFLLLTVVAVLFFLLFRGMAYCKYICPLGSVRAAFGKVGFTWLSTYGKACESCKSFECAKVCDYQLSPFNFDKNGNMEECTLCMKCAEECPSVRWLLVKPSYSLLAVIKRMRTVDVWVYILLLAVISITMRFHHALGRSAIADSFPWSRAGHWLDQTFPSITMLGIDVVGVAALSIALLVTLVVSLGGFFAGSRVLGQSFNFTFKNLGYALAPLMLIGGLSHAGEFFFLRYYSEMGNAAIQAFSLPYDAVAPLAKRGEAWLHHFKLFQYLAILWSYYLFYRRLQLFQVSSMQKWLAFPLVSAPVSLYLGLLLYSVYVFSIYGMAVVRHH